jgi:hypothetical protein
MPARPEGEAMDLAIWIPATVLLGLATMGLMFLFARACDKV